MTNDRTILNTGVTDNQGGAVAQALQGTGFHLRGLTRKPDSQRAAALAGAWGVFGVQSAGEAGVEGEEAQGKRLSTLAREAGVDTMYNVRGIGGRASRISTTSGASRKPCAVSASARM